MDYVLIMLQYRLQDPVTVRYQLCFAPAPLEPERYRCSDNLLDSTGRVHCPEKPAEASSPEREPQIFI